MDGITFVFAGDFLQTLPVISKGTTADTIKACLKYLRIWNSIEKLNLCMNMRAHLVGGDPPFLKQLLKIGDGTVDNENDYITVSQNIGKIVSTVNDLISEIYPDISDLLNKPYLWLCERAIISPRNIMAEEINNIILEKVNGNNRDYLLIDTVLSTDDAVHYPQEFLNVLSPSGFSPHKLKLKIGSPIMLLCNVHFPNPCNGIKLQITVMCDNIIEAIIFTGPATGEIGAFISRIPMVPTDLPFKFKCLQFPIKVSFAITINKLQGQTFQCVGVDLCMESFSHGQLYVELSRTGNHNNQIILI
ncbi:uncharacterized protein LOC111612564 [Centruroides sculpturatus]|uniref:uncharacterized protein LOC111612564 n=1 Tax=Centruroides sculpturatus TaxID=218467 RepID=UPI000C6E66A2|nr:uncharacterized protein LOC111612564 [Centruroides sculpturatus]